MIKRALLSVSDKTGIVELAEALAAAGVELLSTGGTAQLLASRQIPVTEVASVTGFPEMLDGRVKTLHPKIHGGLLGRRDLDAHVRDMQAHGIQPIDLLVVNLYPFVQTIARPGSTLEDAIENIDIGGPAMIRAAAKNYPHVTVVTDPADYPRLLAEIQAHTGATTAAFRFELATKAFTHTARYDGAISNYLSSLGDDGQRQPFPDRLNLAFDKAQDLRYGENPHQAAAFYRDAQPAPGSLATYTQLQGKALSYNNLADADAAWECVKSFEQPACVIVKHANPCGVAEAATLSDAYQRALATDKTSAFGGIVAFNRELDNAAAHAATQMFVEVILAPGATDTARAILAAKPNIRVLIIPLAPGANPFDLKRVGGGLLVQTPDIARISAADLKVVTRKAPDAQQMKDLLFAFRVVQFVKSNAIVFARNGQTLGLGAGQMSRVDSTRIAVMKAEQAQLPLAGAVVASEAFLPFRDNIDVLAAAGATAVIQPGGSVRDPEVIEAADAAGIAMVFTGVRHFRH